MQVEKWKGDNAEWKKKYENEARLRVEETDVLKKKFTIEVNNSWIYNSFHLLYFYRLIEVAQIFIFQELALTSFLSYSHN